MQCPIAHREALLTSRPPGFPATFECFLWPRLGLACASLAAEWTAPGLSCAQTRSFEIRRPQSAIFNPRLFFLGIIL